MKDIKQLHPKLQEKLKLFIRECDKQGLKVGIKDCLRTIEEQDALYFKGRSKPGAIITNAKGSSYSSMHQWGIAFDFYRNDGSGEYNNSDGFFEKAGEIGQSLGLEWGGSWTGIRDLQHLQLQDWNSTPSRLKITYKTPEEFIETWQNI